MEALRFQQTIKQSNSNSLILVEHEPVYTTGLRSATYDERYFKELKAALDKYQLKADFVETNRGGLITFHGPGQLVAYPIVNLADFNIKRSIRRYVELLEETLIETLERSGVPNTHTRPGYPGVWIKGTRKLAFVGISCRNYRTMHGVALNCNCNLAYFKQIQSCGIEDAIITSIGEEGGRSDLQKVADDFIVSFCNRFNCKVENIK